MTDCPCRIGSDTTCTLVCVDIRYPRKNRKENHSCTPEIDQLRVFLRDDIIDDIGQDIRNKKVHDSADKLDRSAQDHFIFIGF